MSKFMITLPKTAKSEKAIKKYLAAWSAGKIVKYKGYDHKVYYVGLDATGKKHLIGLVACAPK